VLNYRTMWDQYFNQEVRYGSLFVQLTDTIVQFLYVAIRPSSTRQTRRQTSTYVRSRTDPRILHAARRRTLDGPRRSARFLYAHTSTPSPSHPSARESPRLYRHTPRERRTWTADSEPWTVGWD
jgi:hypothetical protein